MIGTIRRRLARRPRNAAKKAQGRGDWQNVLLNLEIARRIDPANPAITLQIGNACSQLGRHDRAEACFRKLTTDDAYRVRGLVSLAGVAELRQDWVAAVQGWEQVLHAMAAEEGAPGAPEHWPLSPAMVLVHCALGRDLIGEGGGAERDLALATALEGSVRRSREAALLRARMIDKTKPRAAYRLLRAAHRRYPEDAGILLALAGAAGRSGEPAQARLYAQRLVELRPEDSVAVKLLNDMGS